MAIKVTPPFRTMIFSVTFMLLVFVGVATYASVCDAPDAARAARLEKLVSICEHGIWILLGGLVGLCGGKISH